jgi:peptidoglycan hydrolase-like protein with peptidoglycan-binding domain
MKKIALALVVLGILFGQNTSAQTVSQGLQTTKPAYEKIAVPDQDLNNTNKSILYRYKITAPKNSPLTISRETVDIQAIGAVPQNIVLTVFSDKDFKNPIQKSTLKFNSNTGKQKFAFLLKDSVKVKAGASVFVQIDTVTNGNKDTAYIITKPSELPEVRIDAKPLPKILAPKISYVQAKAANKNEVYAKEVITLYGENINKDTKVFLNVGGMKEFQTSQGQPGSINFTAFNPGIVKDGTYNLYAMNGDRKSNVISITYINPKQEQIKLDYVLGIKTKQKNLLEAGESARLYGKFPLKDPYKIRFVGKGGYDEYVTANQDFDGVLQFVVPKNFLSGTHDYDLFVTKGAITSSRLLISGRGAVQSIAPKISYVQAKAANKNEVFSEEEPVLYGQNFTKDTQVYLSVNGSKTYFDGGVVSSSSVTFKTPKRGVIPNGTYQLFAQNGSSVSNGITITYRNQTIPTTKPAIKVLSPNGGETLLVGEVYEIKWNSVGEDILKNNVQIGIIDTRYSTEVGDRRQMIIANSIPNTGSYSWKVPEAIETMNLRDTDSAVYEISVGSWSSSNAVSDFSDNPFIIKGASVDNSCLFSRDLTLGSTGADVINLQLFLQTKGFLTMSTSTMGYFGATTQAALTKYQASVGISPANGFFGPMTRVKVAIDCLDTVKTSPELEITNISSDVTDIDNQLAEYVFTFEVTSYDKDIYIPNKAVRFDRAGGVSYDVMSPTGLLSQKASTVGILETSSDEVDADFITVREGVTETITLTIQVTNVDITGMYRAGIMALTYSERADLNAPRYEVWFGDYEDITKSGYESINSKQLSGSLESSASLASNTTTFESINLELGMVHPAVISLQQYLNSNGYIVNDITGEPGSIGYEADYFGEKTKQALIKFQQAKGITPAQGYFGPMTRAAMGI